MWLGRDLPQAKQPRFFLSNEGDARAFDSIFSAAAWEGGRVGVLAGGGGGVGERGGRNANTGIARAVKRKGAPSGCQTDFLSHPECPGIQCRTQNDSDGLLAC